MLHLFLDNANGAGIIPCPICNSPTLLGVRRMGRWLVGYGGEVVPRPGASAVLVCSRHECDHWEPVAMTDVSDDAVAFSPSEAAARWAEEEGTYGLTIQELERRIAKLTALYRSTGRVKLVAALRFYRRHFHSRYTYLLEDLEWSAEHGNDVICVRSGRSERGRVQSVREDGLWLDRCESAGLVFVPMGDLRSVYPPCDWPCHRRFDFGGKWLTHQVGSHVPADKKFVVMEGHPLALDSVTRTGLCRVHTANLVAAKALRFPPSRHPTFHGEVLGALVEGSFRVQRYCHIRGHRLYLISCTEDPEILFMGTRNIDTARALKMNREHFYELNQRRSLRWFGYFRRSEITHEEEVKIPTRLPRRCRTRA